VLVAVVMLIGDLAGQTLCAIGLPDYGPGTADALIERQHLTAPPA
jgi:hypothetical protein